VLWPRSSLPLLLLQKIHAVYDPQLVLGGMHQSKKFCIDDYLAVLSIYPPFAAIVLMVAAFAPGGARPGPLRRGGVAPVPAGLAAPAVAFGARGRRRLRSRGLGCAVLAVPRLRGPRGTAGDECSSSSLPALAGFQGPFLVPGGGVRLLVPGLLRALSGRPARGALRYPRFAPWPAAT
jgi:hypothetical protein